MLRVPVSAYPLRSGRFINDAPKREEKERERSQQGNTGEKKEEEFLMRNALSLGVR